MRSLITSLSIVFVRLILTDSQGVHHLPCGSRGGELSHIGQSPIQQRFDNGQFTVTIDRMPFTYSVSDVHLFLLARLGL